MIKANSNFWFYLGILGCLLIAAGAYFWATGMMDSLYAFRSPLHNNPPLTAAAAGLILMGITASIAKANQRG